MTKKITGWAIVATVERQDGTWYTDTTVSYTHLTLPTIVRV